MSRPPVAIALSRVSGAAAAAALAACSAGPPSGAVTVPPVPAVPNVAAQQWVPSWSLPTPSWPLVEPPATVGSPEVLPAVVASPEVEPAVLANPEPIAPSGSPQGGWSTTDAFGAPPAPLLDPRRFAEAHWQGLEVIPNTPALAKALGIPPHLVGVIVDDVTLPADLQGFQAGDLVTSVAQVPTPDLLQFVAATTRVRDRRRAEVEVWRQGDTQRLVLTALLTHLGTANGETASMIPPTSRMPHRYRGPCTNCHRIGTTGQLAVDPGDLTATTAPTILPGAVRPHRDFGPCTACHRIQP